MMLNQQDAGPIWVHVRHRAETCLGGYFQYQGEVKGEGLIREERLAGIKFQIEFLQKKHGITMGSWNDFFLKHLVFYVGWLSRWVINAKNDPGSVFFNYFDDLKDVAKLLTRVSRRYGHEVDITQLEDILTEDRRRKTDNYDWRDGLEAEALHEAASADEIWTRALALRDADPVQT